MSDAPDQSDSRCPKCEGAMEEGFLRDAAHGANLQSTWVAGAPVHSFWTGVRLRGLVQLPVVTFRCRECGFLESYAQRPPESGES